jgi:cytochrome c oxidase subunit IV
MAGHANHGHSEHSELGHVLSKRTYLTVFLLLVFLTVLTVVTAKVEMFNFGNWNIVIALFIASTKAVLVMLWFMHLKFEDPIVWTYAVVPFVLLVILIGGIIMDPITRIIPKPVGAIAAPEKATSQEPEAAAHH